jgi:hypothetical protein
MMMTWETVQRERQQLARLHRNSMKGMEWVWQSPEKNGRIAHLAATGARYLHIQMLLAKLFKGAG